METTQTRSKHFATLFSVLALVAIVTITPHAFATTTSVSISPGAAASQACVTSKNCYNPSVITITVGGTVTWTNNDVLSHTVTSGLNSDDQEGSLFDSPIIGSGKTFSFTFNNEGSYYYHCIIHPWLVGQVIVGSSSQQSGTTNNLSSSSNSNDYSNYSLQQGEWVKYRMSLIVKSNDTAVQQGLQNSLTKLFSLFVGKQVSSLDDIDWMKLTITKVSSGQITTHGEAQILGQYEDFGESTLDKSPSSAIPTNAKIGDMFDTPFSTPTNPDKAHVVGHRTITVFNKNLDTIVLDSTRSNVGASGAQIEQILSYDSNTGILVDWIVIIHVDQSGKTTSAYFQMYPTDWSQSSITSTNSQNHAPPSWIKKTAKWWSEGQVGDDEFIKGIQYLIQQGIITIPETQVNSQPSQGIPSWIKNNAKWWSEGQISDDDFIKGLQYLVQNGIIDTGAVSGNEQQGNQGNEQQGNQGNEQQGNQGNEQQGNQGTSSGSNAVAKDLTGTWQGNVSGNYDFDYVNTDTGAPLHAHCTFSGPITITMQQDGNDLSGNIEGPRFSFSGDTQSCYSVQLTPEAAFSGTVFGSGFTVSLGTYTLSGQFTSDLLRGTFDGPVGTIAIHAQYTASRTG